MPKGRIICGFTGRLSTICRPWGWDFGLTAGAVKMDAVFADLD